MPEMKLVITGMVAAVSMAGHALAGTAGCQIDVSSTEGGRLEIITWDYEPSTLKYLRDHPTVRMNPPPFSVSWHPPASGSSVDLEIYYDKGDLTGLGTPSSAKAVLHHQMARNPSSIALSSTLATLKVGASIKLLPT